ncbi:MAG: hypothetical protein JXR34_11225 [Bacteroidales bacterium]|nr:hypothetical protein [Bacteroidales bacterium]
MNNNHPHQIKIDYVLAEAVQILQRNLIPVMLYTSIYLLLTILLIRFKYSGLAVQVLLAGPFIAGYFNAFQQDYYGYAPKISHFFAFFQSPVKVIATHLLMSIITVAGLYLLVVPGIYFAIAYYFAIPLIINRDIKIWEAMELSRSIITKQWFRFFLLVLILLVFNVIGAIFFGIGLLFTIPLTYAAVHVVFVEQGLIEEYAQEIDNHDTNSQNDSQLTMDMFR